MNKVFKTLGLSLILANGLFASNFNLVNKLFNLDLSQQKLKEAVNYKGTDHTKIVMILRDRTLNQINALVDLFAFRDIFEFKIKEDPKEKGLDEAKFFKKYEKFLKARVEVANLQRKIYGNLIKLALYASDDLKDLHKDLELVNKQLENELRLANSAYQTVITGQALPSVFYRYYYDTGLWGDMPVSKLNQRDIKKWIAGLTYDEFDSQVEFKGTKFYQEGGVYADYFNAYKLFALTSSSPVKANILFGPAQRVLQFYTSLPNNIENKVNRYNLYTFSDFKLMDGTKLISVDYRLLKLIKKRWNKFSETDKNNIKNLIGDNIQNELEYIAKNVNVQALKATGQDKAIEKFYNYSLINNDEGIKDKVIEIFDDMGMN